MSNIVLIACSKKKRLGRHRAKDLYDSELFRKSYAYANKIGDKVFILSAKYGLLHPRQIIFYYNETLNEKKKNELKIWSIKVMAKLQDHLQIGDTITFLAGKNYRLFLEPYLISKGYKVEVPLKSLGIGSQLKRLMEL